MSDPATLQHDPKRLIEQAFEMAQDALRLAIISDIEKGLDPFTRRRAAPESGVESVS